MSEYSDLLPCSFCGNNCVNIEYEFTQDRYKSVYTNNYTARCGTINCFGRQSAWQSYRSKEEAIKAWNTRDNSQIKSLEDKLQIAREALMPYI